MMKKVGMAYRVLAFATLWAGAPTAGLACPDLSGTYHCPQRGNQTPMTLVVSNSRSNDGTTRYRFRYIRESETTLEVLASTRGVADKDGKVAHCNAREMVSDGTSNFINAGGDFEATFAGRTQIVCRRVSR